MHQTLNEVDTLTVASSAKQAWATPAIETYDVAEFTLGAAGAVTDGADSRS